MEPIFMANDLGGTVQVSKNQLVIKFSKGVEHTVRVNTNELREYFNSNKGDDWENDKVLIEPMFVDPVTWKAFVLITIKNSVKDDDIASVFHNDFKKALNALEYMPN